MLIQERIEIIMKTNQMSPSQFADKIGIQRSNLSHVLNGRNKPSLDFLDKIITAFPKVNASWLITGEIREGEFSGDAVAPIREPEINRKTEASLAKGEAKEVEKILVLYKDGTFSAYKPD